MLEDVNFANHMYTKISDLQFNRSISDSDEKLKYNENNFGRMSEDSNIKMGKSVDLDFLRYEEDNLVSVKKKKSKKSKKENNDVEINKNKELRLYFFLFILFCFLNSYLIINIINSYKIQYKLSLDIRASIFLILYYLIKKFC